MDQYSNDKQNDNYPPPNPYQPPRTNGKSIAAMVLGIVSIVLPYIGFIIGILAIIFSAISLKEIKRTGEQGRGMAIAGLVCGIVGTVIYAIIILLIVFAIFFYADSYDSFNSDFSTTF